MSPPIWSDHIDWRCAIDQNPPVDPRNHVSHSFGGIPFTCVDCGIVRQVSRKERIRYVYPDGRVSSNEPSCTVRSK